MEGRGRAFFKKPEESEPGKPAPTFTMAGRGRAFKLAGLTESRPASSIESTSGSGSNSTENSLLGSRPPTYTPSPTQGSTPSPTAHSPALPQPPSPAPSSTGVVDVLGPGGGRGRGLLGLTRAVQNPASVASSESSASASKKTERPKMDPSEVDSVTSVLASSTIDSTSKAGSVKSDQPVHMVGSSGQQVSTFANYIRLNFTKDGGAFEYEVKFDPMQDAKAFCIRMLKEHRELLGKYTFDGSCMYRPTRLPQDVTVLRSPHPVSQEPVTIKVIYKKAKKLADMKHLFNVLFKRIMVQLKMVEFKRQYYDPKGCQCIPQYQLEIWPGYVTAVDEYEGGLMLCINPSHRVLRQQKVLDVIKDIAQGTPHNWENQAKMTLLNQVVMTNYNNKSYKIDDIDFSMTPMSTFETKNGKISFLDYYKNNYGIQITDIRQPLLVHKKEHRTNIMKDPEVIMVCLIPELCLMTGITDDMKKNMDLMKEMARYTRITPNQRQASIKKFIENVNTTPAAKQLLDDWGLVMDPSTIRLNARMLNPEPIIFGDNKRVNGNPDADWGRDVTQSKCITVVDINNWAMIFTRKDSKFSKTFIETLMHCAPPMGMRVNPPQNICLDSDRPEAYSEALKRVIRGNLDIVVCLCPTMRDDRYSAIKMTCCVTNPIPSQVINSRTLSNQKRLRSVVQKVALQMNCKLGGTLWSVNMPLKNIMVIGIDVYHGGVKSCAAFVASTNQSITRWISRAIFQEQGQEIIDGLKTAFMEALHAYYRINSQFPAKIIIYRDGVGEGQLETTRSYEVQQLESCFPLVHDAYRPQMTFVVVHKRINTRIFLELNNGLENPGPGTIVDHTITRKTYYDFFLVSQKVRQGTVTPTHYVVVHDTSGMTPDHLQRLTYKLCHLYYNWPGTVRVPAPCQYAHKLAALIGQSVRRPHDNSLSDKLFYL